MNRVLPRRNLSFPITSARLSIGQRVVHLALGVVLFPFYWLAAAIAGVPGMRLRWRFLWFGLRLLLSRGDPAAGYRCIVSPMDSVRHFEFDFFWRNISNESLTRFLDVSSPRLMSLMLLDAFPDIQGHLVNPDSKDLARTISVARSMGLASRCEFDSRRIDEICAEALQFPLVMCMSVLEHIEDDVGAIETMWSALSPGGSLLLSVPCSARAFDEYSNLDEYELLQSDDEGFVFWQRFYDQPLLDRIFAITGKPVRFEIFGERVSGSYDADVRAKRSNPWYPHWRDSLATARTYALYGSTEILPGMGVIAMVFLKPSGDAVKKSRTEAA